MNAGKPLSPGVVEAVVENLDLQSKSGYPGTRGMRQRKIYPRGMASANVVRNSEGASNYFAPLPQKLQILAHTSDRF